MISQINQNKKQIIEPKRSMRQHANEIYPLSMETKRIFCAYHETQFLTNFCQQKQCLMPLCPSCIAEHTEEHFRQGKKPTYTNINEALNRAKQSCYCTIVTLQEYKKLNHDIFGYISTLQQNIHVQLMSKKNQIFQVITQIFADYETRLIKQINQSYVQKNVYSIDESINASKFIDDEVTNLYEKISLLKGDECLSSLITYYAVDEQNYKQSLEQFDDYFQKNRKAGKIQVSIVQNTFKQLITNLCDNILSVQSIIQNFQNKPQQALDNSRIKSKRYGFNKTPENNPMRHSRKSIFEKENQEVNRNSSLRNSAHRSKIQVVSRHQNDVTFNRGSEITTRQQPVIRNQSQSIRLERLRKSVTQSPVIQTYNDSKLFTRSFKRQG